MIIQLTKGMSATIDDEDYGLVSKYRWRAHKPNGTKKWYAYNANWDARGIELSMHRLIIGTMDGQCVDHKNGDGLDNRRSNLRIASDSQNQVNRDGIKGICWNKKAQKWQASIKHFGKNIYLGVYSDEESAMAAYKAAAKKIQGEFTRL